MLKPRKLQPGDRVAAVSLSWGGPGTFPHRYRAGVRQLEQEFGLEVVAMPHALADADWLRRNPRARVDDWMAAFTDPDIQAVFSTIGGDDAIRLLRYLDLDVLRDNPRIFMGFSDTTSLHLACYQAGLVSFYGPAIMTSFAENGGMMAYTVDSIRRTLFSAGPVGEVAPARAGWTVEFLDWADPTLQEQKRSLNPPVGWTFLQGSGVRRGKLLGGCVEVLDWLPGTQVWPDLAAWQDAILFLETSEDAPPPVVVSYHLRHLAAMGILQRLAGILFARPGGAVNPLTFGEYDRAILQVVTEEEGLIDIPVITGMDFGHTDPVFVLPVGVEAEIDCDARRFSIIENAVED